eukprot:XP_011678177.1 PREDICTED: endonuclease V [Strongylocentrotus purpuratus]
MAESVKGNDLIDEKTARSWESEQRKLKEELVDHDTETWQSDGPPFSDLHYIGGVDISFVKTSTSLACVSLIVCSFPDLEVVYEDCQTIHMTQPYISGFLAFREVPFFMERLDRLRDTKPELLPQIIFVDGNGILHPRGFGTACHLGVLSGIPTVGIAKKLTQIDNIQKDEEHAHKVSVLREGESFDLIGESGKTWGKALRSCEKTINPIYVSVGHRISVETAIILVQVCCQYRIPEPVRQADMRSREYLRQTFPEHYPASSSGGKKAAQKHRKKDPDGALGKTEGQKRMEESCDGEDDEELRKENNDIEPVKLQGDGDRRSTESGSPSS